MPRTRHQCCRDARVGTVNCDAVTTWLTTSGVEKLLESSIWMRYDVAAVTSVQSNATGCAGVASWAGLSNVGADGVGGVVAPVVLRSTAMPLLAPPQASAMSGLVSLFSLAVRIATPAMLDFSGGTCWLTAARKVPLPLPLWICIRPWLPFAR